MQCAVCANDAVFDPTQPTNGDRGNTRLQNSQSAIHRISRYDTWMPVAITTLAEIEQRRAMLTQQVACIPPGPERDHVLAEIEMLHRWLEFKNIVGMTPAEPAPRLPDRSSRPRRLQAIPSGGRTAPERSAE